ncbi:hypothetical protein NDU88_007490 [Pleurodeles waltl]|uniref:Uncharacterized protein n=1 Tax=Pleurodeles waltl TaxID=8319 RepID=A0AAV7U086_PLEWA|nr:hypothetical protein NDU88_007490 [Pleurodeles waltl]
MKHLSALCFRKRRRVREQCVAHCTPQQAVVWHAAPPPDPTFPANRHVRRMAIGNGRMGLREGRAGTVPDRPSDARCRRLPAMGMCGGR